MHISILLWGFTGPIGRGIDLTEGVLVWWRLLIVCITIYVFIRFRGKSLTVSRDNFWKLAWIGTLLMLHWLFFYGAIKYSNVSITLSTFSSTALFTAILDPLVNRKQFRRSELFFSLLAMCGIGLIFKTETSYTLGIILSLICTFLGTFFNILNKRLVNDIDTEVITFYELLAGLVGLTVLLPFYVSFFNVQQLLPSSTDFVLLLILAVFCTHLTIVLSLEALRLLSPFTLNLAINLEPVYGIALAFIFFGENKQLTTGFYIGTGIIILSVLLHALYVYRQQRQAA